MKKIVLTNGLPVLLSYRNSRTAALLVCVNVGSAFDSKPGISHFVEHMVFEGTKSRTAFEITNSIEGIGGEISAYTSVERTCFYVKVLPKHLAAAVDVLLDIMMNPVFGAAAIDKECKVILSEIKLKHDEPRFYQWELFMRSLFKDHPVGRPIIGNSKSVGSVCRKDLVGFFRRFYVASNMRLAYVGPKVDKGLFNSFSGIAAGKSHKSFPDPAG
ncbi:MAG: pitrilysin family protein, partial [Candidatus Woesearchaeota archaeon]